MTTPCTAIVPLVDPDPFLALESWRVGIAMLTMEEDGVAVVQPVLDEETDDCGWLAGL